MSERECPPRCSNGYHCDKKPVGANKTRKCRKIGLPVKSLTPPLPVRALTPPLPVRAPAKKRGRPKLSTPKVKKTGKKTRKVNNLDVPAPAVLAPAPLALPVSPTKKKNDAAFKILNFMRRTKHARKANFLNAICSDSGICLAIGSLADEIKKHFNGFASFDYVVSPIVRIGTPSENGFINQIEYSHRGYKSYAILKSSKVKSSDNLMYEYMVGQYINVFNKLCPCFLETYGYYKYTSDAYWKKMKNTKSITDISILKKGLEYQKDLDLNIACKESKHLAILIQHLKGIKSLYELLDNKDFLKDDLILALFQLYAPLSALINDFTHYDLHYENVQLYEPAKDKYIQYHYHYANGKTVSFKSKYMVKIIDYGRCYVKYMNAKDIYENKLCNSVVASECNRPKTKSYCGYTEGFVWIENDKRDNNASHHYISSQIRNASHDLRTLKSIRSYFYRIDPDGKLLEKDVNNGLPWQLKLLLPRVVYDEKYGTPENLNKSKPSDGYKVYNVEDAATYIADLIIKKQFIDENEAVYKDKSKLGDLHIYMDGTGKPMKFAPI